MTETSKLIPIRVLAVLALAAAACSVDAGNQIPCVDDFSCPSAYPVCVSGKCAAGTSTANASVAVVGPEGHASTDFLSGTVRVIVSGRASSGVKTLSLASGSTTFAASTVAATAPLYAFDVVTTALADGDQQLTATLTAGDGSTATANGTLHVDNAKPTISSFIVAGGASTTITAGSAAPISATFSGVGATATISDGNGSSVAIVTGGSILVSPDVSTTYSLRVTSRSGVSVQSGTTGQPPNVSVSVAQRASTSGGNFSVDRTVIDHNDNGTLSFTAPTFSGAFTALVKGPDGVSVGAIASNGALSNVPVPAMTATTTQLTFTLVISNSASNPDTMQIPLVVTVRPHISSFTFGLGGPTSALFDPGDPVSLNYAYSGAASANINGVDAQLPGPVAFSNIQATTLYTLTVTNAAGISSTQTATATVRAKINSFSAGATPATSSSQAIINAGTTTNLFAAFAGSATSTAALSCAPSCSTSLPTPAQISNGGSAVVTPGSTGTFNYTLTVTPTPGASPVSSTPVVVKVVPLSTAASLVSDSAVIHGGHSATLTPDFSFQGAVVNGTATITGSDGSSYSNLTPLTGIEVAPVATTTYTLHVANAAGTAAATAPQVTVTVAPGSWSALNTDAGALEGGVRVGATITALGGGKVLIAGGLKGTTPLGTARVCDAAGACNQTATSMISPRAYHTAVLIASGGNAGKVLLTGGFTAAGPATPTTSAEFYDPATNSFADTTVPITKGSVTSARARHVAVLLSDGSTVLIAGGIDGSGTPLNTAIKYDASTPATASTGTMNQARSDFTGTLLTNLKVLIVGGKAGDSTGELYDPASGIGTFTTITGTGSSVGEDKRNHTAVRILDPINQTGKVLISGGTVGITTPTPSAVQVLYDPNAGTAGTFTPLTGAPLSTPRSNHAAIALSRDVLICGGTTTGTDRVATCDLYDPSSGLVLATPSMIEARKDFGLAAITITSIDMVLASGGTSSSPFTYAESYEPN